MPFKTTINDYERTSLRRKKNSIYYSTHKNNFSKRAFRFTSLPKQKGSLTVETALVLPIFLFAMITMIFIGEAIRFSENMQNSLHQNAKELSKYAYVYAKASGSSMIGGKLGSIAFSEAYVRGKVEKDLQEAGQDYDVVKGGKDGVSFFYSNVLKEDIVDLVATYQVDTPFDFLGIRNFRMTNRARMHAWTGYDNTQTNKLNTDEEIVYITKGGSVYHKSRNCNHLNLSIRTVPESSIPGLRNKDGGKYYPCEYCGKKAIHGAAYITSYGDRYHSDIGCSGLKRDIIAVPISKVGGRPPCKTCGR